MLNERLISLACYDMRDVTTTDSDETMHADRHAYDELQRTNSPTGGRVQRLQQIT
jgi:hypothetical protein